ncbi:MAG TPA: MBL fold metallo-hydrolase [Polyangiaceae bacterium]|nr:MBL fold metallo-hydrolase [Polyangiaceae bacterium]
MRRNALVTIDSDIRPEFTACYLRIAADECAFIEAHTAHALPKLLDALVRVNKKPEDVRFVVVTHAHLDHAAGASALMTACPKALLVAHPRAAKHLIDPEKLIKSATAVYGEKRFRALYGTVTPIPKERVRILGDGESIELGGEKLTAHFTAGHANHHFVVDDPALETVYTGDSFGTIYPALQKFGPFALPSTSPTNFDAEEAKRGIRKILSLHEKNVHPTHFGGYERVPPLAAQLVRFLDRAGAWVEDAAHGDEPVDAMTARLVQSWKDAIAEEAPRFGGAELEYLAFDIEINAQGLAYVADAKRRAERPTLAAPPPK